VDFNIVFSVYLAVDPEIIARGTVGFSGAELENLVNQAALKAAVDGKEMVTMKELEFSKDKILMGRFSFFSFTPLFFYIMLEQILSFFFFLGKHSTQIFKVSGCLKFNLSPNFIVFSFNFNSYVYVFDSFFCVCVLVELELKGSCLLGKCCTT
jgi:hypothetical protein